LKTVRLLEENIGVNLDIGLSSTFSDMMKSTGNQVKIDKLKFIKLKTFMLPRH
jgi:hypothetical protein